MRTEIRTPVAPIFLQNVTIDCKTPVTPIFLHWLQNTCHTNILALIAKHLSHQYSCIDCKTPVTCQLIQFTLHACIQFTVRKFTITPGNAIQSWLQFHIVGSREVLQQRTIWITRTEEETHFQDSEAWPIRCWSPAAGCGKQLEGKQRSFRSISPSNTFKNARNKSGATRARQCPTCLRKYSQLDQVFEPYPCTTAQFTVLSLRSSCFTMRLTGIRTYTKTAIVYAVTRGSIDGNLLF